MNERELAYRDFVQQDEGVDRLKSQTDELASSCDAGSQI
jgi:hypothetical protein